MSEFVHVRGMEKLDQFFDSFARNLQEVMPDALRAGMEKIAEEAKANVPVASGLMRDGLTISTDSKGSVVTASLTVKGKHGPLAHMIEFGTAAHRINAKKGGVLSFGGGAYQHVDHPGAQAKPFMRPALDARADDAVAAVAQYINEHIEAKA